MTGSGMTYDYDIGGLDALYHSDHLGSASWKKERFGKPFASERADEARSGILNNTNNTVQHLQYLPYGEPYINQHPYGYSERFTFTGKERDKETGYGYVFRGGRLVNSCSGGREDTKALEFIWKYISFQDIIELFSQNGTIILQPQVIVSNYINQKKKKQ